MDLLKLLDLTYLFKQKPGDTFLYAWPLMIFFILTFLASWKIGEWLKNKALNKAQKKIVTHLPGHIRELSVIGAILVFIRSENIPYFSMRIWLVLYLIALVAFAIHVWKKFKKAALQEDKAPKKKKKKN